MARPCLALRFRRHERRRRVQAGGADVLVRLLAGAAAAAEGAHARERLAELRGAEGVLGERTTVSVLSSPAQPERDLASVARTGQAARHYGSREHRGTEPPCRRSKYALWWGNMDSEHAAVGNDAGPALMTKLLTGLNMEEGWSSARVRGSWAWEWRPDWVIEGRT